MRRTFISLVLALAATPALAGGVMHYTDKAKLPADGEEREVAALFDTWNAALATGNPHKVADLYAPDGVLLPTVSNEVRASRAQIEKYFEWMPRKSLQGRTCSVSRDGGRARALQQTRRSAAIKTDTFIASDCRAQISSEQRSGPYRLLRTGSSTTPSRRSNRRNRPWSARGRRSGVRRGRSPTSSGRCSRSR
ncbi:SgcJ/EcaC family oxidoreductase [Xanthomonas hortorum pv. vitians]|nr:SgcJ/EcaC family oxidoreductase [Xanthomonas hortorum]WJM76506.1 SgcJ/EcaC family oxidoreductase [Xanthomonas hortorum pv. vitians]